MRKCTVTAEKKITETLSSSLHVDVVVFNKLTVLVSSITNHLCVYFFKYAKHCFCLLFSFLQTIFSQSYTCIRKGKNGSYALLPIVNTVYLKLYTASLKHCVRIHPISPSKRGKRHTGNATKISRCPSQKYKDHNNVFHIL